MMIWDARTIGLGFKKTTQFHTVIIENYLTS